MGRLIQLAILVFLGMVLYRYVKGKLPAGKSADRQNGSGAENLVQCRHCGVRLPESDAVRKNGLWYCPAHADKS